MGAVLPCESCLEIYDSIEAVGVSIPLYRQIFNADALEIVLDIAQPNITVKTDMFGLDVEQVKTSQLGGPLLVSYWTPVYLEVTKICDEDLLSASGLL